MPKFGEQPESGLQLETSEEEARRLGLLEKSEELPQTGEVPREDVISQTEGKVEGYRVSPEQLQANLEILESNMAKIGEIPETVLQSKEGRETTQSLMEKMTGKLAGFRQGLVDKLATLGSWEGKNKMAAVLGGVAGAAILGPVILQIARSKWPEVGVALDAAPDVLQQLTHIDIWAKVAGMLGDGDMVQHGSIWKNGGIEVSNLLADISSGKEMISSLQPEQLQVLQDGMQTEDFAVLTSPLLKDPAHYATVIDSTVVRALANSGPIAGIGLGIYGMMDKISALANKYKRETV